MVSSVRHKEIVPPAAALLVSGDPLLMASDGQDYSFVTIRRTLIAADVAAGAGTLVDNAAATVGFLFAQFHGALIKNVISVDLIKTTAAPATPTANNSFRSFAWGNAAHFSKIGTRIVNPVAADATKLGYNRNFANLFLYDFGDDPATLAAAGDQIVVVVELGNS
jgi:hypothetical protein